MEPNYTPSEDRNKLEQFVRDQLNNHTPGRQPELWQRIAAEQQKQNPWLRLRHYAKTIALPAAAAVILGLGVWWTMDVKTRDHDTSGLAHEQSKPATVVTAAETVTLPSEITQTPKTKKFDVQTSMNRVPGTEVRFKVSKGITFTNPASGNTVTIPGGTLVRPDGTPASGEATLFVREYRGLADYLAGAVPMHYDDERGGFFFNSGGMFEVRVRQGGEELSMAPGENYTMSFKPTNDKLEDTRLYYFDEIQGKWVFRPDPAMGGGSESDGLPPVVSEQTAARNNRGRTAQCTPIVPEFKRKDVPSEMVMIAVATGQKLASGKMPLPKWFVKNPGITSERALDILERSDIRIVAHRDRDDQFFPQDMNGLFTELRAFKGCYFSASADERNNAKAAEMLRNGQGWQRINIVQENDARCMIVLTDETGFIQFYADMYPAPGIQNFKPDAIFAEYRRLRTERQENFEARHHSLRCFNMMANMFQTEDEWCMEPEEWLEYFANNPDIMKERYDALVQSGMSTDENVAREAWETWRRRLRALHSARILENGGSREAQYVLSMNLSLSSFGLYNCDQIFRLGDPPLVMAGFQTTEGKKVAPKTISMVDRANKIMLSFNPADRLPVLLGRSIDLVVIDRNGKTYMVRANNYAKLDLKNRSSFVFNLEDVTETASTPEGWTRLLEL